MVKPWPPCQSPSFFGCSFTTCGADHHATGRAFDAVPIFHTEIPFLLDQSGGHASPMRPRRSADIDRAILCRHIKANLIEDILRIRFRRSLRGSQFSIAVPCPYLLARSSRSPPRPALALFPWQTAKLPNNRAFFLRFGRGNATTALSAGGLRDRQPDP